MPLVSAYIDAMNSFVGANTIPVLTGACVATAVAVLLGLWSLSRRRGVKKLSQLATQLEYRVHMLEVAEHDRTLRRITARERVTDV